MAEEKEIAVDLVQDFFCEEYGWVAAHERRKVRGDIGERWIEEGKALAVFDPGAEEKSAGVIQTPEDNLGEHETADLKRKKSK